MSSAWDRHADDVGNIAFLEHVNLVLPDLDLATQFFVNTLGFTRDPFIEHGPDLVWINVGRQQFHLPRGGAQVLRGTVELVVPSVSSLVRRLDSMATRFEGTEFSYAESEHDVVVKGPWGNRFRCRQAGPSDRIELGLPSVEFPVERGTAQGIARFYAQAMGALAHVDDGVCRVDVGPGQTLTFREVEGQIEAYDGHHVAIYVANFSGPHEWLGRHDLLVQDDQRHEYRFNWIIDPDSGEKLFEIEHEVRSLYNPLHNRPLVNRNAEQTQRNYVPGADPFFPS